LTLRRERLWRSARQRTAQGIGDNWYAPGIPGGADPLQANGRRVSTAGARKARVDLRYARTARAWSASGVRVLPDRAEALTGSFEVIAAPVDRDGVFDIESPLVDWAQDPRSLTDDPVEFAVRVAVIATEHAIQFEPDQPLVRLDGHGRSDITDFLRAPRIRAEDDNLCD
jgi:hypothetical protein